MTNPTIALIEKRVSANRFDAGHVLSESEIAELALHRGADARGESTAAAPRA